MDRIEEARRLFLELEQGNCKNAVEVARRAFLIQERLARSKTAD